MPSCEGYCSLGEYHEKQGHFAEAAHFYRIASYMIPTRMLPNYLLWKLYVGMGEEDKAVGLARYVLEMPLKVENSKTLRMKKEISLYLERR